MERIVINYSEESLFSPNVCEPLFFGLAPSIAPHVEIIECAVGESALEKFHIKYNSCKCRFGDAFIASTEKGLCRLDFNVEKVSALESLRKIFPNSELINATDDRHSNALAAIIAEPRAAQTIFLHLTGSEFRINVWRALLDIPMGTTETYGSIARRIGKPDACRAVGAAVGANPIAYFIPCHRAVPAGGAIGKYRWGSEIKRELLMLESEY